MYAITAPSHLCHTILRFCEPKSLQATITIDHRSQITERGRKRGSEREREKRGRKTQHMRVYAVYPKKDQIERKTRAILRTKREGEGGTEQKSREREKKGRRRQITEKEKERGRERSKPMDRESAVITERQR